MHNQLPHDVYGSPLGSKFPEVYFLFSKDTFLFTEFSKCTFEERKHMSGSANCSLWHNVLCNIMSFHCAMLCRPKMRGCVLAFCSHTPLHFETVNILWNDKMTFVRIWNDTTDRLVTKCKVPYKLLFYKICFFSSRLSLSIYVFMFLW